MSLDQSPIDQMKTGKKRYAEGKMKKIDQKEAEAGAM